jgi:16S rRNA (cytidine1402-2'-O)-methyltransferase
VGFLTQAKRAKKEVNSDFKTSGLYVVCTPIGNSLDWTRRAALVLESVDIIAAEDTRTIKSELKKIGIEPKQVVSCHEHNENTVAQGLIEKLKKGNSIALVSDAGSPNLNDPGHVLIKLAFENQIQVTPIPGASSLTTLLSVSPLGGGTFFFGGFLPTQDQARADALTRYRQRADNLIFFEAPHRMRAFLQSAEEVFGGAHEAFVGRELTKSYEELIWLPLTKLRAHFQINEPRGEFVIAIKGVMTERLSEEETKQEIQRLLDQGHTASRILEIMQPVSQLPRKKIYDLITHLKKTMAPAGS